MSKIFAFDMDGTILSSGQVNETVHTETVKALKEARAKGHMLLIATGRPFSDIVRDLDETLFDYLVANNGSYFYDVAAKKFIYNNELPKKFVKMIIEVGTEYECFMAVHGETRAERASLHTQEIDWEDQEFIEFAKFKDDFLDKDELITFANSQRIMQLSLRQDVKTIEAIADKFNQFKDEIDVHIANEVYIDINPKGTDKFKGIMSVLNTIGRSPEDLVTFGDSSNDLAMLEEAPLSYAMGNANEEAKKAAKEIIGDNNSDAIAKTIRKLI